MISIAGGMHHIWNHRIKLDVEVVEAVSGRISHQGWHPYSFFLASRNT